ALQARLGLSGPGSAAAACGRLPAAREGATGRAGRTESAPAQVRDAGPQDRLQPGRNAGPGSVRRRDMSQLPARSDLDQLRRQARELYRAALGGDAGALQRLRQISGTVALSTAQLAIAHDYGFPSWPQLEAEVEHRRAQAATPGGEAPGAGAEQAVPRPAPVPPPKSWR